MDDNQLDQFFKNNLSEPEEIPFNEGAWENIAGRIPPANQGSAISSKTWLAAAMTLLLISNAVWAFLYFRQDDSIPQKSNIQQSSEVLASPDSLKVQPVVNRTDTIFRVDTIYLIPHPSSQIAIAYTRQTTPSIFSTPSTTIEKSPGEPNLVQLDYTPNNAQGKSDVTSDFVSVVPILDSTVIINPENESIALTDSLLAVSDSLISDTKQDDRISEEEMTERIDQIEKNTKKEKSAGSFFKRVRFGIGGNIAGWGMVPEPAEKGYLIEGNGGLMLETKINDKFKLITGLMVGGLNYKLDYVDEQPDEDKLILYPQLLDPEPPGTLHEIYQNTSLITIPIWARYYLKPAQKVRPYVLMGLDTKVFLKQEFTYEYLNAGEVHFRTAESKKSIWYPTTVRAALGIDFHLDEKLRGDVSLFAKGNLAGQGEEKQQYFLVGIGGGLWLGKH